MTEKRCARRRLDGISGAAPPPGPRRASPRVVAHRGGQRLVLKRLREGPLLFASFTSGNRSKPEANGMTFTDQKGKTFMGHGMYAAVSFDDGKTWPVRKLLTPGEGEFDGGAWTKQFTATPRRAEHAGYLAATQTPDRVIHLISSRLHYRINLPWLLEGVSRGDAKPPEKAPPGQMSKDRTIGSPRFTPPLSWRSAKWRFRPLAR